MSRLVRINALIILTFMCGCVNFMSLQGTGKDITSDDVNKITPGMTEKEVVSILGRPQAFGVDNEGREYIHYETGKISRVAKSAAVPFAGAISSSTEFVGFIVNFYLVDGSVKGKSQYFYRAVADEKKSDENKNVKM